ncbi:MAG TPA: acetyl-CoA decarbonylase/synthase complex subunit gamma [Dissulfurispiraceae bacterium]|nr:acetyl-CoA decarbonylase/synthase complex subunit gamma [Dissulfurispiraceae bacterium]
MALSGVQIFKLLPKTNCKKCGHPTCLAFAMKLAQRQASVDACPDMSVEARQTLGAAAEPPVRSVTFGVGQYVCTMGEETVLFRHEKKFVRQTVLAVRIADSQSDEVLRSTIAAVRDSEIERIGQKLRIDALYIDNASGDCERYQQVVRMVIETAPHVPLMLAVADPVVADAALKLTGEARPLLCGITADNIEMMAPLALAYKVPVCVRADGLESLSGLTEKMKCLGVADIVMDSGVRTAAEILRDNTLVRRAAIKKNFRPLGFPLLTFAAREDGMLEALVAMLGIAKYSSAVVLGSVAQWRSLALFTYRQNIYTDPQVPMQVEQKIYKVGEPGPESPVIITTNFSLTYFIVAGEIENSRIPVWLAVMDCEGMSVLTAWAAGKFTAAKIAQFLKESGIEDQLTRKELVLPGYVAILSGALEDKLGDWAVTVGPREANQLPAFLKAHNK